MSIPDPLDTLTSGLASICRLPSGVTVQKVAILPEGRLHIKELYDVENNNACRKVRERITELDLVVEKVIPAAPNSRVFTDSSYQNNLAQGTPVPRLVLVDGDGKETVLSGEDDILQFFNDAFPVQSNGQEDSFRRQAVSILRNAAGKLAGILRTGRGTRVSQAASPSLSPPRPNKPLILYSYEGNQFCRLVREVLTELDLVYELRSAGKESPRRQELAARADGSTQCPYLIDPNNNNVAMAESADIIAYLYQTYAMWTPPNEILQWTSDVILPLAKPIFRQLTLLQAKSADNDNNLAAQQQQAKQEIEQTVQSFPVVVYTYSLSPFSSETKALLDRLGVDYEEQSLGAEWFPGLLAKPQLRAALLEMTGQSSLPHVFIGGKSIGGLFSGTPGLVPALEQGILLDMVAAAREEVQSRIKV